MPAQLKIFTGSVQDIERDFNAWANTLKPGTAMQCSTVVRDPDGGYLKEVLFNEPVEQAPPLQTASSLPRDIRRSRDNGVH